MTDIEISFQKAVQAFHSSDLDLAIELFKTIVSKSPDHVDAHIYLGQAHFKNEQAPRTGASERRHSNSQNSL